MRADGEAGKNIGHKLGDLLAEFANTFTQDIGALWSFAFPERQRRWSSLRVFDKDAPFGFDGLSVNGYTLNLLKSSVDLPKVKSFQDWLFEELE